MAGFLPRIFSWQVFSCKKKIAWSATDRITPIYTYTRTRTRPVINFYRNPDLK